MTTMSLVGGTVADRRLDPIAFWTLLAFVAAIPLSIAVSQSLLTLALVAYAALVVGGREPVTLPRAFWPLLPYAGWTLLSATFSADPWQSLADCKQLALFAIVPMVCRVARHDRAGTVLSVVITVGALSALVGIVQYGILQYDHLGRRPQGTLTHYMTYSGALMLVTSAAAARLVHGRRPRSWTALVMPALVVALVLTFTRSAWVGTCAAVGALLVLRDYRMVGLLPIAVGLMVAFAPAPIVNRVYSMFDLNDPTNRDRVAMLRYGTEMVRDHPVFGVGPDMVKDVYPVYVDEQAVEPINPHVHNVPLQIAAERGVPALAIWLVLLAGLSVGLFRRVRSARDPALPAAGLAAVVAMLTAGLFEYNFGDSEFLMLWLVLVALPFADEDSRTGSAAT